MAKSKMKINTKLLVFASLGWFLIVSFLTAQTEYQRIVADKLADPQGTSTQLEGILSILIVLISFMPSGFALAYPYVKKNFEDHKVPKALLLSLGIALALYIPFGWYNFAVNFGE